MAGSAYQSPAPVLPRMGLHSFHNDSPPFAATATEHPEPEPLSLDGHSRSSSTRPDHGSSLSKARVDEDDFDQTPSVNAADTVMPRPHKPSPPVDIRQTGGSSSSAVQVNGDEHISSFRSRRLVSGYHFGVPPSSDTGLHGGVPARHPTPPRDHDSPPLSEAVTSDVEDDSSSEANDQVVYEATNPIQAIANMAIQTAHGLDRRRYSRARREKDRSDGYDRLNGLHDGEADKEDGVPAAGWGSEAFLKKEPGEAGQYRFPRHRLRTAMKDESKIPLVIVACGSFSPPTYLHLRMFEMAKDEIIESQTYEIMAGYYSPVSSHYKKAGLAPAIDRVRMCELAVEHTSTWLMVDPWEAGQPEYQRTAVVLDHFENQLNGANGEGGLMMSDGKRRRYKVMLLAGGDLIESFGEPGVWSEPDLHHILGKYGCFIIERAGSDVWAFLLSHDILYNHRRNVIVTKQLIYNDISSTKVRLFVKRGMSIKYLLPNSVIQYIYDHQLYRDADQKAT